MISYYLIILSNNPSVNLFDQGLTVGGQATKEYNEIVACGHQTWYESRFKSR